MVLTSRCAAATTIASMIERIEQNTFNYRDSIATMASVSLQPCLVLKLRGSANAKIESSSIGQDAHTGVLYFFRICGKLAKAYSEL